MKQRDDYLFKKILFFVFLSALALGAYISLGPRLTSLIGTVGSINVMNLSGTFRVFMFIQFVALFFSIIFLLYLTISLVLGSWNENKPKKKNLWHLLRFCMSQISVGGLILNISWSFYFLNKSLAKVSKRIQEKKTSKSYFINHIVKSYSTIKSEYLYYFSPSLHYAFLKGFLSLLFWAVLSLLLVAAIRWQAGTGGCEYCWLGDTQNKKELEAKILGYPIRWFVKVPNQEEFEYIDIVTDYVKYNSENRGVSESQYRSRLSDPKFREIKTCWRQFILALLLFYAFFLRLILSGCYFFLFFLSTKSAYCFKSPRPDFTLGKTNAIGRKPELIIERKPDENFNGVNSKESSEPTLLLALECGLSKTASEIQELLGFEDRNAYFFGNVLIEDRGSQSHTLINDDFSKFLENSGSDISDIILFIDLCGVPAQDYLLNLLYENIFQWVPRVQKYWVIFSNGDTLRKKFQNNPLTVKQKVSDRKSNIEQLIFKISGCSSESISFIDWFDTEFHSRISEYKLKEYFQSALQSRYKFRDIDETECADLLLSSSFEIILRKIDECSKEAGKIDINNSNFSPQDYDEILKIQVREGESQLYSLYRRGAEFPNQTSLDSISKFITESVNGAVDTLKTSSNTLISHTRDSLQSINEDSGILGAPLHLVAKRFFSHGRKPQNTQTKRSYEIYLSNLLFNLGTRLTEYSLALELDGYSITEKTRVIHDMLKFFSPSVFPFNRKNLEETLTQISEKVNILKSQN